MFKKTETLQIQIDPGNARRVLHSAQVVELSDNRLTIVILNRQVYERITPPMEVALFFKDDGHFMRQNAILETVIETSKIPVACCQLVGPVEPAESRECFRAVTALSDLTALLDNDEHCQVLDISASGLAVKSEKERFMDQKVMVAIEHEGQIYSGPARIRNIRPMAKGFFRYGLVSVDTSRDNSSLARGLNTVSMAIQREQLKRLSGQDR